MTRIRITPLVKTATGVTGVRARLTARPTYPFREQDARLVFAQTLVFEFEEFQPASIDLDPPVIDAAWVLTLTVGPVKITRTVSFAGPSVEWDDLIDVDPRTLDPVPTPDEVAAWEALRRQIEIEAAAVRVDVAAAVAVHVQDATPHPVYDDMPDLILIFENKVMSGAVADSDGYVQDLATVFTNNL